MNIVYHGRYIDYWEWARTEMLREQSLSYKEIEEKGYMLPCIDLSIQYLSPSHYDDIIETELSLYYQKSRICFDYVSSVNSKAVAKGSSSHIFTDKNRKPMRIPAFFKEHFHG